MADLHCDGIEEAQWNFPQGLIQGHKKHTEKKIFLETNVFYEKKIIKVVSKNTWSFIFLPKDLCHLTKIHLWDRYTNFPF